MPGMPDQSLAGLEQPLLKPREGPILDGDGENEPAQQVAESRCRLAGTHNN
jgi:hypothetical protein